MICIRRARAADAEAIGAVHVTTWRTAYAGVLPDEYLADLSPLRHAAGYEQAITDRRHGHAVFVAVASGAELAIVTQGQTPYDSEAAVKLDGDVVEDMTAVLAALND